jgi:hypothetical protein
MSKIIIYGAGLIVVAFVVGLLLFLTFDNVMLDQAIYSNGLGVFAISGPASLVVNIGIVGIAGSLVTFITYLFSRHPVLLKSYKILGVASCMCVFIGLAWG